MPKRGKVISAKIPETLYSKLRNMAERDISSTSEAVRIILREYLNDILQWGKKNG